MVTDPKPSQLDPIATIVLAYKDEAFTAGRNRLLKNRENFDVFHLRQDYSYKKNGQSKEFLGKQALAVEQITSFLQQGLMDQGEWFRIEAEDGLKDPILTGTEIQKLILRQLAKNDFAYYLDDALKLGQLGALMISKIGGKYVDKVTHKTVSEDGKVKLIREKKKVWQLNLSLVRQEDWFPDPTGRGLYQIQRCEMDYHELLQMAHDNPDIFDIDVCKKLKTGEDQYQKLRKARETDQNVSLNTYRRPVTIFECWGDLVEPFTGEVLHKNCVTAVSLDGQVVAPPRPNPMWHECSPYVVSPIFRVPHSVWHKAMMDAPTRHNIAINEIYNLMVDAGIMSVFGVKQVRPAWLMDPAQIADGISPGETLTANSSCPPGGKVLERIDTGALQQDALQMYNLMDREFQQSSYTSDTRLGTLPQRAVKATELVQSNQAITGVFNGMIKIIEELYVARLLEKSWLTMAQHCNDFDEEEVEAILGEQKARLLSVTPNEELFAKTASGHKYKVFGLSMTLNKIQDFKKYQALLQTIGTSPVMMNEFSRKYSMTKLLGEVIKSLDVDEAKISIGEAESKQVRGEALAIQQSLAGGGAPPDNQSQIPQAASTSNEANPMFQQRNAMNEGMTG